VFRVPSRPTSNFAASDGSNPRLSNTEFAPGPDDFEREFDSKIKSEQRQEMDSVCNNGVYVVRWVT